MMELSINGIDWSEAAANASKTRSQTPTLAHRLEAVAYGP